MVIVGRRIAAHVKESIEAAQAKGELPAFEIPEPKVTRPNNPDHGDYATPVAMQLARLAKMAPNAIAEAIANNFPQTDFIATVERIGGFINFRLDESWLQAQVDEIIKFGDSFAQMDDFAGQSAQVEFVSANPTGPITVGRVRGGIIGDTLARLLEAVGYDVQREYYFNNAGRQMEMLGRSLKARYHEQLGLPNDFPEDGYLGAYLYSIADELIEENSDELKDADWEVFKDYAEKQIFASIRESLTRVNIHHDNFFNENTVIENGAIWEVLKQLDDLDLVYKAQQPEIDEDADVRPDQEDIDAAASGDATWFRIRQLRDTQKDVALVRADGRPTYRLPDFAYHKDKMERGFDLSVNILGGDHIEEAKDVKAAIGALGYDQERLQHIIHQFVTLTEDGETRRQSTRSGEFVTLNELVEDVGPDAARYFMLKHAPNTELKFDLDLARSQSNENPVYYIQNAHVRCAGIMRQAKDQNLSYDNGDVSLLVGESELALIRKMIELPEIIALAVQELAPHKIAYWAHEELARQFHPTYDAVRAMHGDVPEDLAKARLKLYAAAQIVIRRVLTLMGMSAPERM